jgi:huntingtin interacting protein 1
MNTERARDRDEKFQKLKEVYSNLRKEHIALLRQKAEVEKALGAARAQAEQLQRGQTQAEERLQALISERSTLEEGLQQSASQMDSAIAQLEVARDDALREVSVSFSCQ